MQLFRGKVHRRDFWLLIRFNRVADLGTMVISRQRRGSAQDHVIAGFMPLLFVSFAMQLAFYGIQRTSPFLPILPGPK